MKKSIHLLVPIVFALALAGSAQAGNATWQNVGTNFNSTTAGDWVGGTGVNGAPAPSTGNNGDVAVFATPTGAIAQPNLTANLGIKGLSFSTTTASGYDLTSTGGFTLTIANAGIAALNTSGTNTIDTNLAFTSIGQTITQTGVGGGLELTGIFPHQVST